jgi:hypothetical protein
MAESKSFVAVNLDTERVFFVHGVVGVVPTFHPAAGDVRSFFHCLASHMEAGDCYVDDAGFPQPALRLRGAF